LIAVNGGTKDLAILALTAAAAVQTIQASLGIDQNAAAVECAETRATVEIIAARIAAINIARTNAAAAFVTRAHAVAESTREISVSVRFLLILTDFTTTNM